MTFRCIGKQTSRCLRYPVSIATWPSLDLCSRYSMELKHLFITCYKEANCSPRTIICHCCVWTWNLISRIKARTQAEGVRGQGAEGGVGDQEGGSDRRLEKTAWWGASWFVLLNKYCSEYEIEDVMGRTRSAYGVTEKDIRVLMRKPEGNRLSGRPRRRWNDDDNNNNNHNNDNTDLDKIYARMWTGSIWLRIGTCGVLL